MLCTTNAASRHMVNSCRHSLCWRTQQLDKRFMTRAVLICGSIGGSTSSPTAEVIRRAHHFIYYSSRFAPGFTFRPPAARITTTGQSAFHHAAYPRQSANWQAAFKRLNTMFFAELALSVPVISGHAGRPSSSLYTCWACSSFQATTCRKRAVAARQTLKKHAVVFIITLRSHFPRRSYRAFRFGCRELINPDRHPACVRRLLRGQQLPRPERASLRITTALTVDAKSHSA